MRRVVKWLLWLAVVPVLLLTAAYFLAKKYEEPVRNYIVKEVNKRLDAPVHVSDINFSLLNRFPSASLVMDSVWAEENIVKIGDPDTLFFFRKVYLNLNIFDILGGQYKINEIEAVDGFMHLLVDEQGYDNYRIWKSSEDTTGFLLELDKVHVENGELRYLNVARDQEIRLGAEDLWFKGKFSSDNYTMAVEGDGLVHAFIIKGTNYLDDRQVAVQADLDIETPTETYAFQRGRLIIDDALDFAISGVFNEGQVDLHIVGSDLDVIRSLSLIPSDSRTALDDYESSGTLGFDCTLKGAFGKTDSPRFKASFSMENATISKRGTNWRLSELTGSGSLDNGEQRSQRSTTIVFDALKGKLNQDPFETAFSVQNLEQPHIDGRVRIDSEIEALHQFFDLPWLEEGSGKLALDAQINTVLKNPSQPEAMDFLNSSASGFIQITDANLRIKDDQRSYRIDSAAFEIRNNALVIRDYTGKVNSCSVQLSGEADQFLDYFFTESGKLAINGKVKLGDLNLEELFPSRSSEHEEASVVVAFPTRANWNLQIVADSFTNGKFQAQNISGTLVMNAFKVEASSLKFQSQEGSVSGKVGLYRFADNQFGLRTNFSATDLNVKTLFHTFNNFEQDFITDEHLSGRADVEVDFQAFCDSVFQINISSVVASTELTLRDGSIKGFEPLISVADVIHKKRMLRTFIDTDELRKRLQDVEFATLHNEISIRNEMITIPRMDIRSSAIDLSVAGTHTFDNHIHYDMDFAVSELLQLKERKEPYNEYVERDQDGKTRIYLTMEGTTEDFDVDVQKLNLRRVIREEMASERNTVRDLFKEEFHHVHQDSTAEPQPDVQIEFDPEAGQDNPDSQTPGSAPADTTKKKEQDKNLLNRFIKKTETDKKKLREGEFEDDDF